LIAIDTKASARFYALLTAERKPSTMTSATGADAVADCGPDSDFAKTQVVAITAGRSDCLSYFGRRQPLTTDNTAGFRTLTRYMRMPVSFKSSKFVRHPKRSHGLFLTTWAYYFNNDRVQPARASKVDNDTLYPDVGNHCSRRTRTGSDRIRTFGGVHSGCRRRGLPAVGRYDRGSIFASCFGDGFHRVAA
jgi:hypothetical protein